MNQTLTKKQKQLIITNKETMPKKQVDLKVELMELPVGSIFPYENNNKDHRTYDV